MKPGCRKLTSYNIQWSTHMTVFGWLLLARPGSEECATCENNVIHPYQQPLLCLFDLSSYQNQYQLSVHGRRPLVPTPAVLKKFGKTWRIACFARPKNVSIYTDLERLTDHWTRSRSLDFDPWYGDLHEGQSCSVVARPASFRRTIAIETVMPALMVSFQSFAVKIPPPLSFVIWYLPAFTQLLPTERLKLNFK